MKHGSRWLAVEIAFRAFQEAGEEGLTSWELADVSGRALAENVSSTITYLRSLSVIEKTGALRPSPKKRMVAVYRIVPGAHYPHRSRYDQIVACVESRPGVTCTEIANILGAPPASIYSAISHLSSHGRLIKGEKFVNAHRWYPVERRAAE